MEVSSLLSVFPLPAMLVRIRNLARERGAAVSAAGGYLDPMTKQFPGGETNTI